MADDALNILRAANPVPDPDRLAVAGEAAEPADPTLQDLLDRARRIRADETDDELLDRRENEGSTLRPVPLRRRDNRRLTWLAAAASLMLIAGAVVWTTSQNATTGVDVVGEAPPAPAETEGGGAFAPGAGSTCTGDGRAGFVVGPDGAVEPGEPPQGTRFRDDKDGRTRFLDRLSITEASVAMGRGNLIVSYALGPDIGEPAGEIWHTLWLRSEDGTRTGVIRAEGSGRPFPEHRVRAGTDLDDLRQVDGRLAQGNQPVGGFGGPVRLTVPADALPVMGEPFLWTFEIRAFDGGVGDICPSGVDPEEPLADPSRMARFPETD